MATHIDLGVAAEVLDLAPFKVKVKRGGGTAGHKLAGLKVEGRPRIRWGGALLRAAVMLTPFEANHAGLFHGDGASGDPGMGFWIGLGVAYGIMGLLLASCLWDRIVNVGGMHHFMLSDGPGDNGRYGAFAMERLVELTGWGHTTL